MYKHKKMNKILSSVGIALFGIITTAAAAASIVLESGIINVSYAQVLQRLPPTGPEATAPGQNPMCDPTDTSINTTESHVCGIPKTPSATGAAAESTTTESPSSISPSSPGSMIPPSGSSLEPIPGLLPITTNNTQ
jgi:hypothetical protein